MNNRIQESDFIGAGFKQIDDVNLTHPRKIKWGKNYLNRTTEERLAFAEKLAYSMNDAADKLQTERNELNRLCILKEGQLETMKKSIDANNEMLQGEITRMNADRQKMLKTIADLKQRVRELESGNND